MRSRSGASGKTSSSSGYVLPEKLSVSTVVMIVGTSALFPYITGPVLVARDCGRLTVEINPEPTACTEVVEFSLRGPAGAYLPLIERAL